MRVVNLKLLDSPWGWWRYWCGLTPGRRSVEYHLRRALCRPELSMPAQRGKSGDRTTHLHIPFAALKHADENLLVRAVSEREKLIERRALRGRPMTHGRVGGWCVRRLL